MNNNPVIGKIEYVGPPAAYNTGFLNLPYKKLKWEDKTTPNGEPYKTLDYEDWYARIDYHKGNYRPCEFRLQSKNKNGEPIGLYYYGATKSFTHAMTLVEQFIEHY